MPSFLERFYADAMARATTIRMNSLNRLSGMLQIVTARARNETIAILITPCKPNEDGIAMPISDTRKWKVNKPANEILKIVNIELLRKNAKLLEANSKRIEATLGSEATTRFFGGFFVSKETLPVKITLYLNESATETEIDATIQDNFGFGLRTGMVGKYKEYIQNLLNWLAAVLEVKS
jgi:hypothetical protein